MSRLLFLPRRSSLPSSLLPLFSHLHSTPSPPPFSVVQPPPPPSSSPSSDESDPELDDFLSRFIHRMKRPTVAAIPDIDRTTRDAILVELASRLSPLIRHADPFSLSGNPSSLSYPDDPLPPHLLDTAWDAASASIEDMRRARRRDLVRRFLHDDTVKGMCRFAAEVGIRGSMLREFRFKWTQEKLEEWEFIQGLRRGSHGGEHVSIDADRESLIPERKGEISNIYRRLDLSEEAWTEATYKVDGEERRYAEMLENWEAKPLMGKSRVIMERILAMDVEEDVWKALEEWAEVLEPRRPDWLALLDRIRDKNLALYAKVAELLLDEESFHSDIRDYSRLLEVHSNENNIEDAERILQKMADKDIKPDIFTSMILVRMYSKTGNITRMEEEFGTIRKQGLRPDSTIYEAMIRSYLKVGNVKVAEMMLREMENLGTEAAKEIYVEILRAFSLSGQVDGAQRIVYTMQYAGIPQTLESYALLIEAYVRVGDPDHARSSFDIMMRSGLRPDDRSIAGVVAAYEKKNLLDKALDFLLKLEKDRFKPGIQTYCVLVDWLGRLTLVDEVEKLLEKISERGDIPFSTHVGLCGMYSRDGNKDKALKSLKILLAKKEMLTSIELEKIIDGLLTGGLIEEAKRVNDIMHAQGFEPTDAIKLKMMRADVIPK